MFKLVHEVPGRLRLIGPKQGSEAVVHRLRALPGVNRVLIRPASRSLIVFYDGAAGSREAVLSALRLPATSRAPAQTASRLLDLVLEPVAERLAAVMAQALITAVL